MFLVKTNAAHFASLSYFFVQQFVIVYCSDYGSFEDCAWQANPSSGSAVVAAPTSTNEVSAAVDNTGSSDNI